MAVFKLYFRNDSGVPTCYVDDPEFDKLYETKKWKKSEPFFCKVDLKIKEQRPADCYPVYCATYPSVGKFESKYGGSIDKETGMVNQAYLFNQHLLVKQSDDYELLPIVHLMSDLEVVNYLLGRDESLGDRSRFIDIIDSSIWNLMASDGTTFAEALKDIASNYSAGYYNLAIANEYADLNARLVRESYIWSSSNENSSHGDFLSPFIFHSEKQHYKSVFEEDKGKEWMTDLKHQKWRFLLLDDKCKENLSMCTAGSKQQVNKAQILCQRIEKMGFNVMAFMGSTCLYPQNAEKEKAHIIIECVDNIEQAKEELFRREYDIILLDYLLGDGRNDGKKHYGYELITELKSLLDKSDGPKRYVGPDKKYFFMFISAFTISVDERLREKGIFRSDKYWYIGEGSCPTNTPYLFMHQLLQLMHKRIEDCGIIGLTDPKIKETLSKIYLPCNNYRLVKKKADEQFHNILSLLYDYKGLLEDVAVPSVGHSVFDSNRSVLCTDFIMSEGKQRLGSLLEHVTHMVYLTAFGTVRQWPEIWEEYRFVSAQIGEIREIEEYILSLKSDS